MIKILIVDDVPIFLDYLRGCIDWAYYGFEICAEAHDGIEGLKAIEDYSPDIVLTDITMPYMDGLAFAEKIAKHYPNISTLLITGNMEFDYARRAVKIGVCDYIVKPFEKEELLISLLKQKDNINRALEVRNLKAGLETEKQNLTLRKLILGRHRYWGKHMDSLEKANLVFSSDYFRVCVLKTDPGMINNLEEMHDWEDIIIDILKSRIEIEGSFYVFADYENNIVILMNFADEQSMKAYKSYDLQDLKKILKRQLNADFSIGTGDACYSLDKIKESYSSALAAASAGTKPSLLYSWDVINNLTTGLEQLNATLIEDTLAEEFEHFRQNNTPNMQKALYSGLISILLTHLIKSGQTVEAVFGSNFHPYTASEAATGLEEGKKLITDYYLTAIRYREKHTDTKSHQIVEKVKEYINSHYNEHDLCIADISRVTLINQTYLRSMFKEETNGTITEYITKLRMTEAARLLRETDEKLSEIAEKTGYADESYFSKAFKKYYGITPKSYGE